MSPLDVAVHEPATYVQRRRTAGWRAPVGAVSCTRAKYPTRWGNPFKIGDLLPDSTDAVVTGREHCVQVYREWLRGQPIEQAAIRLHLAGKPLMCWCAPGQVCHVQDVIIPLINEGVLP